jgi:hypothetical protein
MIYQNLGKAGSLTVKADAGVLGAILVNSPEPGLVVALYDNVAVEGQPFASVTVPAMECTPFGMRYDVAFAVGLTVELSANADVTVVYE